MIWLSVVCFLLQIYYQTYIFPDSESYLTASNNLYLNHKSDAIRPILIAGINGFPLLFTTKNTIFFLWNIVVNGISWFFCILLIFKIISKIINRKSAFVFSLIYMTSIGTTILIFNVLSEIIFVLFLMISLFFIQKYLLTNRLKYLAISFSILIASILIKPISLILIIIFIVLFFFQFSKILKSKWSSLIIVSISLLLIHLINMKKNYGDYTISYIDAFTYYNYLGTRADCLKNGKEFIQCDNERHKYFNTFSLTESKKVAFNDIKYQLSNNTIDFVKAYSINIYKNSTGGCVYLSEIENKNKTNNFKKVVIIFKILAKIQNVVFSILGFLLSFYFLINGVRQINFIKITAVVILYILLLSAISSEQGDRFHLVIYPFVLILTAKFLVNNIKLFSEPLQK